MAAPTRRVPNPPPRLGQASIEWWKAENQKLRERNQSLHRRLHKYKKYTASSVPFSDIVLSAHCKKINASSRLSTEDIDMSSLDSSSSLVLMCTDLIIDIVSWLTLYSLADAIGNTGQHPAENIPPPGDSDPTNPIYSFDTTDIFPDFDPTTFHIFLQMLSRFCIYKPDNIQIDRIKQIWRIRDYFDIPTLILNEDDLVNKIRVENMNTFQGVQKEFDFALRYNWKALKNSCLEVLRAKTADFGGLTDSMRDAEIMGLLNTLVIAERRKSGIVDKEEESMSGDALEGVRWTTPSENENDHGIEEILDEDDEKVKMEEDEEEGGDADGNESSEVVDETTMDLLE
jgi:hypothetical protein